MLLGIRTDEGPYTGILVSFMGAEPALGSQDAPAMARKGDLESRFAAG